MVLKLLKDCLLIETIAITAKQPVPSLTAALVKLSTKNAQRHRTLSRYGRTG
jgi:hypothetical protein